MLAGYPTSKLLPAVSVRSSSGYCMISGFEFPKQERTDRIAAHYRVEKLLDVFGLQTNSLWTAGQEALAVHTL